MSGRRSGTGRAGPTFNTRSSAGTNRTFGGTHYNNTRSSSAYGEQDQAQQNNQPLSSSQPQTRNQASYNKTIEIKEEIIPVVIDNNTADTNNTSNNSPETKNVPLLETPAEVIPTKEEEKEESGDSDNKMAWRKGKLNKVKVSNSEKRRRQNKRLRKLLTPKNALMVLNELHGPNVPEYKLGQASTQPYMNGKSQYKAEVVVNGSTYQGQGVSKIMAKNNAAEKALRDLVLERMRKEVLPEVAEGEDVEMAEPDDKPSDAQIPMLHLASFALHKLFSEWQAEGFEIPLMSKNLSGSIANIAEAPAESGGGDAKDKTEFKKLPKMRSELPPNPECLHPSMLLSQMRPGVQYVDVSTYDGISPNNGLFTVSITVDEKDFFGAAKNKKEARRQAAQQACTSLFGVKYPPNAETA